MENLSRFYIDIATDANKMAMFNVADKEQRVKMLNEAGIENAEELVAQSENDLRQTLARHLVDTTGEWHGLETKAANAGDNRSNSPFYKRMQNH